MSPFVLSAIVLVLTLVATAFAVAPKTTQSAFEKLANQVKDTLTPAFITQQAKLMAAGPDDFVFQYYLGKAKVAALCSLEFDGAGLLATAKDSAGHLLYQRSIGVMMDAATYDCIRLEAELRRRCVPNVIPRYTIGWDPTAAEMLMQPTNYVAPAAASTPAG